MPVQQAALMGGLNTGPLAGGRGPVRKNKRPMQQRMARKGGRKMQRGKKRY